MNRPGVTFNGVWKKFRRGERHDSLRDLIPSTLKRLVRPPSDELTAEEFWAVNDVSFEVAPGEALGIIGPNGAGKSTVLKLLTRILKPTRGRCEVRGRAGALIEVAAGFHPDLTGRENVYLQGAIMGMKQAEIARKFSEIVEFAGITEFIDTPVKRYSSGMNARLGFAIAAHLDPDVLLIDEVLSVGDARFQERCGERMHAMRASGVVLVFVSHNLTAVLDLCNRAVLIDHGRVKFDGEPGAAVQAYRSVTSNRDTDRPADGGIRLAGVEVFDDHGRAVQTLDTGDGLTVRIHYKTTRPVEHPHFAVDIHRGDGVYCHGTNTRLANLDLGTIERDGHIDLVIPSLRLLPGCYSLSIGILDTHAVKPHDVQFHAYPFSVASNCRDNGLVALDHTWRLSDDRPARFSQARKERTERTDRKVALR
jgi:homopolymeric O-antigen transport system ATP-binding protein